MVFGLGLGIANCDEVQMPQGPRDHLDYHTGNLLSKRFYLCCEKIHSSLHKNLPPGNSAYISLVLQNIVTDMIMNTVEYRSGIASIVFSGTNEILVTPCHSLFLPSGRYAIASPQDELGYVTGSYLKSAANRCASSVAEQNAYGCYKI